MRLVSTGARSVCLALAALVLTACGEQQQQGPARQVRASAKLSQAQACPLPAPGILSTQLVYVGPAAGEYNDPLSVAALLTDAGGNPLPGRAIAFALGAQTATATTDANGVGRAQLVPTSAPGSLSLSINYAGDAGSAAASSVAIIALAKEETVLHLSASTYLGASVAQPVSATLTEPDGTPIAGKPISFSVADATATATTNALGVAQASLTVSSAQAGTAQLRAAFAGDLDYDAAADQAQVALFQTSSFVIWGGNAAPLAIGQDVNFWGHSWADQVAGGDYAANPSFKGFANQTGAYARCEAGSHASSAPVLDQGCWSTKGGNSFPPASLPTYIGVLVSTAVGKSGSVIFGNIAGLAVLQVDATPAYSNNPGHPGYGHLVALDLGAGFPRSPRWL